MRRSIPSGRDAARRAFTLIELLVVVAIIAILIGILLPALGKAREAAWQIGCASMQSQLAKAVIAYSTSEQDWIPGINTSGSRMYVTNAPGDQVIRNAGRRSNHPVQAYDWISPSIGSDIDLPQDREHRMWLMLENLSCPSMRLRVPVWGSAESGTSGASPGNDQMALWVEENAPTATKGVSFLMPIRYQLFGGDSYFEQQSGLWRIGSGSRSSGSQTAFIGGGLNTQFTMPTGFVPKTVNVGLASKKVMMADGFRYLDRARGLVLDYDAGYTGGTWGSFTGNSPCSTRDRPWGRAGDGVNNANVESANMPLAYRHGGKMTAMFFDGHGETFDRRQSRDPVYWTPSGSTYVGGSGTDPDTRQFGYDSRDPAKTRIP